LIINGFRNPQSQIHNPLCILSLNFGFDLK
jgi:hypothetical protein